jgi:hypothetical protein
MGSTDAACCGQCMRTVVCTHHALLPQPCDTPLPRHATASLHVAWCDLLAALHPTVPAQDKAPAHVHVAQRQALTETGGAGAHLRSSHSTSPACSTHAGPACSTHAGPQTREGSQRALEVVPVDRPVHLRLGGHPDDARRRGRLERLQQQVRQQEGAVVVCVRRDLRASGKPQLSHLA